LSHNPATFWQPNKLRIAGRQGAPRDFSNTSSFQGKRRSNETRRVFPMAWKHREICASLVFVIRPSGLFPNIMRLAMLRPLLQGKAGVRDEPRSLIELEFGGMGV